MPRSSQDDRSAAHRGPLSVRTRTGRLLAGTVAATVVAAGLTLVDSTSASAAAPISQATGRYLSGSIAGTNLDTIAGIEGESATNPADPGPNKNSLNAELLNKAIQLPFKDGLQLPGLGAIELGAVSQYAAANGDGSALGASGTVDSNGGIGVGGSNGVPKGGATIDLAGLPGAKAVSDALGDLKLTIGAVSARATQVKNGSTQADPSASCVTKPYNRVSDPSQAGQYEIAGLTIDLTSNALNSLGAQLFPKLGSAIQALETAIDSALQGVVTIEGLPDASSLAKALSGSAADGSITLSLTGGVHIDLAGLLAYLGLDLNKLCPNTSLLPYLATALATELPKALVDVVSQLGSGLTDALGKIVVKVGGVPIALSQITDQLKAGQAQLTDALTTAGKQLNTAALQPLIVALTKNLLNVVVNGQQESGGKFTETALALKILPSANGVVLDLASASVGPSSAAPTTPPASTTPASPHPSTQIPTGVNAGAADHGGTPVAPIVLLIIAVLMAGAGAMAWRVRGRHLT